MAARYVTRRQRAPILLGIVNARSASAPSYPDTGCEFSPSCLNCPLPQCQYDMTKEQVAELRQRERHTR